MNYFKALGIVFGLLAMLKPFYLHLVPWNENKIIAKAYTEKRPKWIFAVGILGLLLVAFTWYKELSTNVAYSMVVTIIFSLTAIKALMFIFNYDNFQKWVAGMLERKKGRKIVYIDIVVGVFGLLIVVASGLLL